MRYVDLINDCQIIPYEAPRNPIAGSVGACLRRHEHVFLVIDRDVHDDRVTLAPGATDSVLLVAAGASLHITAPATAISGFTARRDDEYGQLLAYSLTRFFRYCEFSIGCTVARLKTKRAGDQALIEKENVRLSIADYYRFLCLLRDGGAQHSANLNALADRVLRAADIISNLLGGISILHHSVVEIHLNYARWLRKLEVLR